MTQSPESYGKAMFQLGLELGWEYDLVMQYQNMLADNPPLVEALCSQMVKKTEKFRICERLFDPKLINFSKFLCDKDCFESVFDIISEYEVCYLESKNIAKATLRYVHMPEERQLEGMKKILCNQLGKDDIMLVLVQDPSILGGCVLFCGSLLFDKSVKGSLEGIRKRLLRR